MKASIGLAMLIAVLLATPAHAQEPSDRDGGVAEDIEEILDESGIATAVDSIARTSAPELERALGELALVLSGVVDRVANDPELRRSALEAAEGMVLVAEVVVAEQAEILQEVLRTAADEIERMPRREPAADASR